MKIKGIVLFAVCFVLIAVCYFYSQNEVKAIRSSLGISYRLQVMPVSPKALRIVAGEFKGILANYLLMEIAAHIGSNQALSREEWEKTVLAFKQTLTLDPYFQQAYLTVQGFLPWEADMTREAIELLEVSKKHRVWEWRPGYYMGFDYYFFLKDYANASEEFLEAGKMPDAPPLVAVLGARFAQRSGRTRAAIRLLRSMLADKGFRKWKEQDIQDRIKALQGVLVLEQAVTAYKRQHGGYPDVLEDLVKEGFISQLPENPYYDSYEYDEQTGQVFFDELR